MKPDIHLCVAFELTELESGEEFFKASLPLPVWNLHPETEDMPFRDGDHMPDGELWLRVSLATIPLVASVVLLWLGKGKKVRLRRGNTSNEIELVGYSANVTKELVERWIAVGAAPLNQAVNESKVTGRPTTGKLPSSSHPRSKPAALKRKKKSASD